MASYDKVVYVEPNAMNDFTTYQTSNNREAYKSIPNEDLSIIVELEVEIKSRTAIYGQGNDGNTISLTWQSSANGTKVSFSEGSKIYTNKEKNEYIKALTTNYTDCNLFGIMETGTAEMFGIKSVDISYTNFMVPQVTIQFIDVRGVSLFAQEEMRHDAEKNNIQASINENIEGSFFKSFFTFPYPKFTLRVKGFYGDIASYELTCSDFRAAFESTTGNFNVTAKFVGYAFSFLTDVMVNCLTAAPYSEYFGKKYWDENVKNGRFTLEAQNSVSGVAMTTLVELCTKYKEIRKEAAEIVQEKGIAEVVKENGGSEDDIKSVSDYQINNLCEEYDWFISQFEELKKEINSTSLNSKCGNRAIQPDNTNSFAFIIDDDDSSDENDNYSTWIEKLEDLSTKFNEFNNNLRDAVKSDETFVDESAKSGILSHYYSLEHNVDYDDITDDGKVDREIIREDVLAWAIDDEASKKIKESEDTTYGELWYDGMFSDSSDIYWYQDWGLGAILETIRDDKYKSEKESDQLKRKAEEIVAARVFLDKLGFTPSVENITKIIMAHCETFIHMVSQCSRNIENMGTQRSASNLGIPFKQYNDIGAQTGVDANTIIAPFPKVITKLKENGITKDEETWIGSVNGINTDYFEEIKLVNGILNGVEETISGFNSMSDVTFNSKEKMGGNTITNALTYFDLFLKDDECPFGKIGEVNISDANEVFARLCVRAFSIFATQKDTSLDASYYGLADAENFIHYFGKDELTEKIGSIVSNESLTVDKIISYLSSDGSGEKIDSSKSGNPWPNIFKSLIEVSGSNVKLVPGFINDKQHVFTAKDWNFNDFDFTVKDDKPQKKDFMNCIVTPCFDSDDGDVSSMAIGISEANLNHFRALYQNSTSSQYGSKNNVIDTIFKDDEYGGFEFNGWDENRYKKTSNHGMLIDVEGNYCGLDKLNYTDHGEVINANEFSFNINDFFLNEKNMKIESSTMRAVEFALNNFAYGVFSVKIGDKSTKPFFANVTKFDILRFGALMKTDSNVALIKSTFRPSILKFFEDYFNKWVNEVYETKIEENFSFKLKQGFTLDDFNDELKKQKNKDDILSVFNKYLVDPNKSMESYDIIENDGDFIITPNKSSKVTIEIIRDLMKVVTISFVSKFNKNKESYILYGNGSNSKTTIKSDKLKDYFTGVLEVFKVELKPNTEGNKTTNENVSENADPDDIKLGVYNYIKLLYDKWLASGEQEKLYTMEKMFGGDNPLFYFIDSAYNRVGKTIFLNLSKFVQNIVEAQTVAGYALLSLFSNLYASNKFTFLCIQNFLDFSNPDVMNKVFKPLSYLECHKNSDNHPNFIVMMPYEASNKLDIEGADYPDDGFYLNRDESTWPEMIRTKQPSDLPIPAFGVSYGQQYQNYFKDVQVDMNSPMSTEQSIKAKFMIAGVNRAEPDNGESVLTYGQDLYSIYSNNSYTCTVTMMGCAWIQPMMYFVLTNIPMFHGSYWVVKVNHQIRPGFMTTTFKGVRMAKSATRSVKNFAWSLSTDSRNNGLTNESNNGGYNAVSNKSMNADISNDCPYAYFSPLSTPRTPLTQNERYAYCVGLYNSLTNPKWVDKNSGDLLALSSEQAKGICANVLAESGFDPYVCTIDGSGRGLAAKHGVGGGLCGFYYHGKAVDLFNFVYGNAGQEKLNELNNRVQPFWENLPVPCHETNKKLIAEAGIYFPVSFEKQVEFIQYCTTLGPYNSIRSQSTAPEAANDWMIKFENPKDKTQRRWASYGEWVESALKTNYELNDTYRDENDGSVDYTVEDIASGLTKSFTNSLRASKNYKDITVSMNSIGNDVYEYTTSGENKNNALFDCALSTYNQWFDKIEWYVGNSKINNDALSVRIHIVNKKPNSHIIVISGSGNVSISANGTGANWGQIDQRPSFDRSNPTQSTWTNAIYMNCISIDDINPDLKMSLIKYFKSASITTASAAKSVFRSCQSIPDDQIIEKLLQDGNAITSCDSVIGSYAKQANCEGGGVCWSPFKMCHGNPIPGEFIQNNNNFSIDRAIDYIINRTHSTGNCATAVRSAIDVGFGTNPDGSNSYTGKAGRPLGAWCYIGFLPRIGFKCAGMYSKNGDDEYSGVNIIDGDIAVYQKRGNPNEYGHICMWTGNTNGWVSDHIQHNRLFYYPTTKDGKYEAFIFRFGA